MTRFLDEDVRLLQELEEIERRREVVLRRLVDMLCDACGYLLPSRAGAINELDHRAVYGRKEAQDGLADV